MKRLIQVLNIKNNELFNIVTSNNIQYTRALKSLFNNGFLTKEVPLTYLNAINSIRVCTECCKIGYIIDINNQG